MTEHDFALAAVRQANPRSAGAAGPEGEWSTSELLLQIEQRSGTMQIIKRKTETTPSPGPSRRRGLLVGAAALVAVLIVGTVTWIAVLDDGGNDVAGSGSRVIQLTFDGEQCTYEGPSVLSAGQGQVEVVYHNQSSEDAWFNFARLDEDKTTQDMIDYIADDPTANVPSWTVSVWAQTKIPANSSSTPVPRTVTAGLHNLACGTGTPQYAYFGGELTVTP